MVGRETWQAGRIQRRPKSEAGWQVGRQISARQLALPDSAERLVGWKLVQLSGLLAAQMASMQRHDSCHP